MNLLVHELVTSLSQRQTTPTDKDVFIEALRPHLVKYGSPAGSLYMEVRTTGGTLVATSETVTIAAITAASGAYFHGNVRFYTYCSLPKNTSYDFYLKSTGYTYAESAWIGWCNDFDLKKYEYGYTPVNYEDCPLNFEDWGRRIITKGIYP